jgi:hypothetical protein
LIAQTHASPARRAARRPVFGQIIGTVRQEAELSYPSKFLLIVVVAAALITALVQLVIVAV